MRASRHALTLAAALLATAAPADPKPAVETLDFEKATADHPRHSEAAVVELTGGKLLCVWQKYSSGHKGDSDFAPNILASRVSADGGKTWGDERVVARPAAGDVNIYSPSLVRLPSGELLMTYMRNLSWAKVKDTAYPPTAAHALVSTDDGKTWAERATVWAEGPYSFASSVLVRTKAGRLVLPITKEDGPARKGHFLSGAAYSDDGGKTWAVGTGYTDVPRGGAMEPHIAELADGRLLMAMRTQMGSVYKSYSKDGGATWTPAETMGVEAPESCPGLYNLPGTTDLLLVWNPKYDPKGASHGGKRTPLVAAVSTDGGATWGKPKAIETDPGRAFTNPGVAFTSGGRAVFNYWSSAYRPNGLMGDERIDLKLALVDLKWLTAPE